MMSITQLTNQNFEVEVLQEKKPVLIDFWAAWCGPCRMFSPIIDEIEQEKGEEIKVCKVNIDEQGELAQRFGVMSIPTIVVMKDGKVTASSVGLRSKADVLEML